MLADRGRIPALVASTKLEKGGRTMSEYEVQANDFLAKAKAKMTISRTGEVKGFPFDPNDDLWHYRYQITLSRKGQQYRFTFYDSFNNWRLNKRPSRYDVLAAVEKYEPDYDFERWARDFGFDVDEPADRKRAKKTYETCQKQYERLLALFGADLMADLREIW